MVRMEGKGVNEIIMAHLDTENEVVGKMEGGGGNETILTHPIMRVR